MSIFISVVVPTYNRVKTVKYCIDSILNQTYNNIEIIVVDDCSTDNTIDIIKNYSDSRIKIFILDNNSGAQVARNLGIMEAKGDWIAFQDSDDEWLSEKLEKQVHALKKVNFKPFTVIHTNCIRYYPHTGKSDIWLLPEVEGKDVYNNLLSNPGPMFQGMLTSRLALEKINYLDENVPSYQEWDTSIRLARFAQFIHLKEPLFVYYFHKGETISKDKRRDVMGYEYIINKFENDIKTYCGEEVWEKHLLNQLYRCLEFELWQKADEYFRKISSKNHPPLTVAKICRRCYITPAFYHKLKTRTGIDKICQLIMRLFQRL